MQNSMPTIAGFNVPLALRQLGNNLKLYTKLLDQFQRTYEGSPDELAEYMDAGDFESASRVAHTVKGLAGSLGVPALQEVAAKLEKLCRAEEAGPEYEESLAAYRREINAAIGAIRDYLSASSSDSPQASAAINKDWLLPRIATLAAYVNDNDARALMLFDEIRPQLSALDADATAKLGSAFELFDFTEAAGFVALLRGKL